MQITVDIITARKEIYNALVESEDHQSIIGIASPELGPGMFMTSVKEVVHEDNDVLIVLSSYDATGYFLEKNIVSLSSITGVIPFKTLFVNPFLKELQKREPVLEEGKKPDYLF